MYWTGVDEEEHLVERGEQPEGRGEHEADRRQDGGATADQIGRSDDEQRADDQRGLEDVAEAAVDDRESRGRRH